MDLSTSNLTSGWRIAWLSVLIPLLLVSACKKDETPKDILTPEQMAAYMVDIYIAEARVNGALVPRDSAKGLFAPMERKLLEQHAISDSLLKKSYAYYLDHPVVLEKIYDSVIDTLVLREQRAKVPVEQKP